MYYECISKSEPVAFKDHRCIWCGESITKGERHYHEVSRFCGDFQDHRWHFECFDAAQDYFREETEFDPYSFERGSTMEKHYKGSAP